MRIHFNLISGNKRAVGKAVLMAILFAGLMSACDRKHDEPGWDYFPDMVYSPAYQTWSENPLFEDGKTMQPPVEGTIPRNMIPFQYEKTEEDADRAGRELFNPLTPTGENIERGEKVYSVFCMNCHGEKGDGSGHLFTSGRYLVPPASLVEERVRSQPDGKIYHTISVGYGVMAEHASLILPADRWKAILYIRQELQSPAE